MKVKLNAPSGTTYNLFSDMTKQNHLLVAGATGSGKSVVINGILTTLLYKFPWQASFILIDPKRVELSPYKHLPHTIRYASEPREMVSALQYAMAIVDARYREMEQKRQRIYNGSDIYVIVDEWADLVTTNKKQVEPLMQRLLQIGRASRVHVILATQSPICEIINTKLKCNLDSRVGLRTRSNSDSRNIIGHGGLENLPKYGQGVYMTPEGETLYKIPYVDETEQRRLISWWERQYRRA